MLDVNEAIRKEGGRRRFSLKTIQTYQKCAEKFFKKYAKHPKEVTKKDIREFLEELSEKNASGNTINVYLNALKFYFEEIMGRKFRINIKYSKKPKKLPVVLAKEEVKKLLGKIRNWKHKLMVETMYGSGLRVSELLNLKVKDLDLNKGYGFVRQGKGNKDRIFIIPKICQEKLINLIGMELLDWEDYIFQNKQKDRYSARSIQQIIKKAAKLAEIRQEVHPHTLRHSFATHLIENGCSLNEVQALLGHKSPETSMIYVHMASPRMINAKSPLDSL